MSDEQLRRALLRLRPRLAGTNTLLADVDHAVCEAYGVWGRKKFMGNEYDGVFRTTFVIGKDGQVVKVFENVKPDGHSAQVLEALRPALTNPLIPKAGHNLKYDYIMLVRFGLPVSPLSSEKRNRYLRKTSQCRAEICPPSSRRSGKSLRNSMSRSSSSAMPVETGPTLTILPAMAMVRGHFAGSGIALRPA